MTVFDLITLAARVASASASGTAITLPRMTGGEFRIFTQALRRRVAK